MDGAENNRQGQLQAGDRARDKRVQNVIVLEGLANLLILVIKLVVGLTTGSFAIIADAIHSFSDLANNVVVWFVIRLSAEPPDRKHPYGHRKFETVAVFALAVLLFVIAIELVLRAFQRGEPTVDQSHLGLVLMFVVLLINVAITLWERHQAKKLKSDILHADASHTLSDVLTTVVVIAGWQLSVAGILWPDKRRITRHRVCKLYPPTPFRQPIIASLLSRPRWSIRQIRYGSHLHAKYPI